MVGQAPNVQVPGYAGVNIQIFNPTVSTAASQAQPQNVNNPNYATNPLGQAYPANYYTNNYAPQITQAPAPAPQAPQQVQAMAPVVVQQHDESKEAADKKKTEKRDIVIITDDYIKTLEGYLNDQKKEVRLMGAKEVLARLQEDDSRKNDPALNALVNKMLQDPYQPVRFLALAALEARAATGDHTSVRILSGIKQQKTAYGDDSLKASNVLLKMSGVTTQKEFEVTGKEKSKSKD